LKPEYLRSKDITANKKKMVIRLNVISGHHLVSEEPQKNKHALSPFVKVRVRGMKKDESRAKKWNSSAGEGGINP
jgi:hypothetical protein